MTFIKSIIVGVLAILPGVSGSALAISFNIYDKFFISIKNINSIRHNKKFLLSVIFGILIGLYIGSNFLIYFLKYKVILSYLLIGLIISEIPSILFKIKKNGKLMVFPLFISFFLSFLTNLTSKTIFYSNNLRFIKMLIGGFLYSLGKVFPGISSSSFLISLGIYKDIILVFSKPSILLLQFNNYIFFFIGLLFGLIIFSILLNYLINNKYNFLYSVIIGFIISSVFIIMPKICLNIENILGFLLMIFTLSISIIIKAKKGM